MNKVESYKINIGKGLEIHRATEKLYGFDGEVVSTSKLIHYDGDTGEALFKCDKAITLEEFLKYDRVSKPILNN